MLQWLFATLHLLALGCGLGAIAARGRNLAATPDAPAVQRSLRADNWWCLSLLLWLVSGSALAFSHMAMLWSQGKPLPLALAKSLALALLLLQEWRSRPLIRQCRQRLDRGRLPTEEIRSQLQRHSRRQLFMLLLLLVISTALRAGLFNTL
ncbi:hypothetical protein DLM_4237 [Aquitalea magnusonii]|jgi:hypothetical protein|uniref:Uncharacterized protein n=1 Tax=Aquitalea magnusonii TaxID=332411 RepID=A0A3G9GN56_9NEIS|nr:DUF2214 family protein [Aquitalea magnusonii]BBF87809.1 hypothetical protein DLM_4237 [Aquitalea magnusonii]